VNAETLRRIRRIELRMRRLVDASLAGAYHSVFKGRGMEFDTVRPYDPGDDIRSIDWNVTARTGEPFVKQYVEERELTVMLALDTSASTRFGTVRRQKRDAAAELGAALAYSAVMNNDRAGLLLFSDQVELYVPPRKGRNHILRLIRDLLAAEPRGKGTDLALGLQTTNRLLRRRSIVFFMSDFLASAETYARDLAQAARRHDVIAVTLGDPLEQAWPSAGGLTRLRDVETGELAWVDSSQAGWQQAYRDRANRFRQLQDSALAKAGVDRIDLSTEGDTVSALAHFFERRSQRIRL
jgi:uncharacterized protein (DUF58 family)